jgi:hypothetical protein
MEPQPASTESAVMVDRADWYNLANSLRNLHRTLLECARNDYERKHLVTLGPSELLQFLITNPDFDWLRSLSALMVEVDVVQDAAPHHKEEIAPAVRVAVEHLVSKTRDPLSMFAQHYWTYVHEDLRVAMAHAGVMHAIAGWPQPQRTDTAGLLHERHRLTEKARLLSHRNPNAG